MLLALPGLHTRYTRHYLLVVPCAAWAQPVPSEGVQLTIEAVDDMSWVNSDEWGSCESTHGHAWAPSCYCSSAKRPASPSHSWNTSKGYMQVSELYVAVVGACQI